jgi:hypothetical protein
MKQMRISLLLSFTVSVYHCREVQGDKLESGLMMK